MTATEGERTRQRRRFAQLAVELHNISQRPENENKRWNWSSIAVALRISAPTAQHLVQWMRKHYTELYWTVGIYASDYMTVPTRQARVALDGMLNQQRHLITRIETMKQGCETLASIDPDPSWRSLMEANAGHFTAMLNLERDFTELLVSRAHSLGWQPMEHEDA